MAIVALIWGQMGDALRILDDRDLTEEDPLTLEALVSTAIGLLNREVVEMGHLPGMDIHLLVLTATTVPVQVILLDPLGLLAHTDHQDPALMGLRTGLQTGLPMVPRDKWLIGSLYQDTCLVPRHLGPHNLRIPRVTLCPAAAPSPQTRSSITMRTIKADRHLAKEPQTLKGGHNYLADWRVIKAVNTMTTLLQPASGTL